MEASYNIEDPPCLLTSYADSALLCFALGALIRACEKLIICCPVLLAAARQLGQFAE